MRSAVPSLYPRLDRASLYLPIFNCQRRLTVAKTNAEHNRLIALTACLAALLRFVCCGDRTTGGAEPAYRPDRRLEAPGGAAEVLVELIGIEPTTS